MAINKNHESEELDGTKCAIVEKNVLPARAGFLKQLLSLNGYTVVVVGSPPAKTAAPAAAVTEPAEAPAEVVPAAPETFTVGVTDLMFNPINAIFGRLLKTREGRVVTLAYWQQQESISHEEVPYYENR